jgi:hypothetical protein
MQLQHPSTLERFESAGEFAGEEVASQPASTHSWDFLTPKRDEVLALLKPGGERKRTIAFVAGALLAGFGLGWACGPHIAALNPFAQTETPSRQISEQKSGAGINGPRKTASTSGLQAPAGGSAVSALATGPSARPTGAPRLAVDSASQTPLAQANAIMAAREPVVPAAETRPTTIDGWTVLDVRGGTVVLEGPDGVRTAARGDTVPGIGRIDSIVRWGNRWIVATASGLIATP